MLRWFQRTLLVFALAVGLSGCSEDTSDETTMGEVKTSNALLTAEGVDHDKVDAAEDANSTSGQDE